MFECFNDVALCTVKKEVSVSKRDKSGTRVMGVISYIDTCWFPVDIKCFKTKKVCAVAQGTTARCGGRSPYTKWISSHSDTTIELQQLVISAGRPLMLSG